MLKTIVTLLALCSVCVSAVQQTDEETKLYQDGKSSVSTSEKFFFGTLSTQSHTIVSYTTSTVFFSCLVAFSTPAADSTAPCMGKRRRRRRRVYVDNGEVESAKGYDKEWTKSFNLSECEFVIWRNRGSSSE